MSEHRELPPIQVQINPPSYVSEEEARKHAEQILKIRWSDRPVSLKAHDPYRVIFEEEKESLGYAVEQLRLAWSELMAVLGFERFLVGALLGLTAVIAGLRRAILAAACSDRRPRDDQ